MISVYSTKISDNSLEYFENFPLTRLAISNNINIKNDFENLKNKNITALYMNKLNVSNTKVDDNQLKEFTDKKHVIVKNLKFLNISNTKIIEKYINNLKIFNLEKLLMSNLSINNFEFLKHHKLKALSQ
jgi:hypothetical protein